MQTDKGHAALELAESRLCGAMLAEAMRRGHGPACADCGTKAFLVWQLGEAAMRLAVSVDREEGDAIVAAFSEMSLHTIMDPGAST